MRVQVGACRLPGDCDRPHTTTTTRASYNEIAKSGGTSTSLLQSWRINLKIKNPKRSESKWLAPLKFMPGIKVFVFFFFSQIGKDLKPANPLISRVPF